ncbi:MAG: hypothetical protein LUC38_08715 [Oscillospiraceae bacterium]|nr:hypothetical protein [Ruminococcus sp.]MCD8346012.1 hypothetical protein [Oscillospiraceae bacterium]
METIREQLVRRPFTQSDRIKQYAITIISFIVGLCVLILMINIFNGVYFLVGLVIGIALAAGILYLGYYLIGRLNVEYEYCVAGTSISVDKIIDKKKRKSLCSFDLRDATGFYHSRKEQGDAVAYSVEGDEGDIYTIEFSEPKSGRIYLYFTPDEKTLSMVSVYLPRLS